MQKCSRVGRLFAFVLTDPGKHFVDLTHTSLVVMDNIVLYNKLNALPENLKKEVEAFIDKLLHKNQNPQKVKPVFGSGEGMFTMSKDFDEPLDDFSEYMN